MGSKAAIKCMMQFCEIAVAVVMMLCCLLQGAAGHRDMYLPFHWNISNADFGTEGEENILRSSTTIL